MTVKDLFGNNIEVTHLRKAIEQAAICSTSPYLMRTFILRKDGTPEEGGYSRYTIGEYHKDLLTKLQKA